MKSLHFTIIINTSVSKVRDIMLNHPTYEKRTSAFGEWWTFEWSRDKWADIKFVDPSGQGMISKIIENRLHEYISIQSLWQIMFNKKTNKLEKLIYDGESIYENYTFTTIEESITKLDIDMTGLPESYVDMFNVMRPNALVLLKNLCQK